MRTATGSVAADEDLAAMANAVGAAVARQLGAHLTELMKRFDEQVLAVRRAADRIRADVIADLDGRLEVLELQLGNQRQAGESYQRAMLEAFEDRIGADLRAVHDRLDAAESGPLHIAAGTAAAVAQVRASVDERVAGIREIAASASASSERSAAEAAAVRDVVAAEAAMRRDHAAAEAGAARDLVAAARQDLEGRLAEIDAALADTQGRVDAGVGRTVELAEQFSHLDDVVLDRVRNELSSVVGEATLVRIEMDRLTASTDGKLDRHGLRMSEIEAQLADHTDTSAAVQLERLDELERAVAELDPDQFVRREPAPDPTASRAP